MWRFSSGSTAQSLLNPKNEGFIVIALVYSPGKDLTSAQYFTDQQTRPLSGDFEAVILHNTVDVTFIRGTSAPPKCTPLANIFSNLLTLDDSQTLEHLMGLPAKSQRYTKTH